MSAERSDLERRAAVHGALADPTRLAVLDALLVGDAAPSELGARLGLASNLLAHHLKVLEDAGVARRVRSEGDRRRTYVTLVPEALDQVLPAASLSASRVIFVCTRNSARSQLAAALWTTRSGIPVASAGTHPAPRVHPRAVAAAARQGMRLADGRTCSVADQLRPGDFVVAVCDEAHEELGDVPRVHWSVPDPVRRDTDDAFDRTVDHLDRRVGRLAGVVRSA